jgi:hypothetical protein
MILDVKFTEYHERWRYISTASNSEEKQREIEKYDYDNTDLTSVSIVPLHRKLTWPITSNPKIQQQLLHSCDCLPNKISQNGYLDILFLILDSLSISRASYFILSME